MDQGAKSYWAEFLGTFTLCFIGQGAVCVQQIMNPLGPDLLVIAIAHGLAMGVMVTALGAVSGGHFNPATTFGFVITGRQSWTSAITYWISQLLGAVVASFALLSVIPPAAVHASHLGAPSISPEISVPAAVLIEFVLTFLLVTAVWGTTVDERAPRVGGFAIGLAVLMDTLVGGPLTGAAMNPARAFGATLASGHWNSHWVYWVAPMLGGAVAARVYHGVILKRP